MKIQDIMLELAKNGITTSMSYDSERKQVYIDLQTDAKSHLHLYEDGIIRGRYDYENFINFSQSKEYLILNLCDEFNDALHGRNYCQKAWADLCRAKDIELKMHGI